MLVMLSLCLPSFFTIKHCQCAFCGQIKNGCLSARGIAHTDSDECSFKRYYIYFNSAESYWGGGLSSTLCKGSRICDPSGNKRLTPLLNHKKLEDLKLLPLLNEPTPTLHHN